MSPPHLVVKSMEKESFLVNPIGLISQNSDNTIIFVFEKYRAALKGLTENQWLYVLVWLHLSDTEEKRKTLKVHPMGDPLYELRGVFATRSPVRPNPIGLYLVRINYIDIKKGILKVTKIDAYENTPVIDIKPYVETLDSPNVMTQ